MAPTKYVMFYDWNDMHHYRKSPGFTTTSVYRSVGINVVYCLLIGWCCIAALYGCTDNESKVRLSVSVKTNQGDPIDGATIALDGKNIGASGSNGVFHLAMELPIQSRKRLEVKKESATYYFAPHIESFVIADAPNQDVSIAATLYFVPKIANDEPSTDIVKEPEKAEPTKKNETQAASIPEPQQDSATIGEQIATKAASEPEDGEEFEKTPTEAPLSEIKVVLTPVSTEPISISKNEAEILPKLDSFERADTIFTVHALSGDKPVANAQVFLGQSEEGELKPACVTNARGRCVVRLAAKPIAPVTFVTKKKGYQTKSMTTRVTAQGQLRMQLTAGQTIDIFAVTKSYNHILGLSGVEVLVKGKRVGLTDHFGHYAHVVHGASGDQISIALKPPGYLPEIYETDFINDGPMTLVRYFTPLQPPPVRLSILEVQPAGKLDKKNLHAFEGAFDDLLRNAAKKHLYAGNAFQDYSFSLLTRTAARLGRTPSELVDRGWQGTELKSVVDVLLLPTLLILEKPVLELCVIDSKGQVLAAAKEDLDSLTDKSAVERAVGSIVKKIIRIFPFEGAVLSSEANTAVINLGQISDRGLKAGDLLDTFGTQTDKFARTQTHRLIATLVVRDVEDKASRAAVNDLAPRASLRRGDLVMRRTGKSPDVATSYVQVQTKRNLSPVPLSQANIYLNDQWLGATDETGKFYLNTTEKGTMKVIKHGFQHFSHAVELSSKGKITIDLQREAIFLRLESKPTAATVKLDGVVIGKTPLTSPVPVTANSVKLEIEGPAGYKPHVAVLRLDQDTLDFTESQKIILEQDLIRLADPLIKAGKFEQAVARLNEIPKEHSQYLQGRHLVGEIFLTQLNQPAKAAEAFGQVTQEPAIRTFFDKRFIGSHIDEGIALFMAADRLAPENPEAAKAHYTKAIEILTNVEPQLRFVPPARQSQATHNVAFHIALARHKLWIYSQDPRMLGDVVQGWRSYLDGPARNARVAEAETSYVKNAQIYYRQAQAQKAAKN